MKRETLELIKKHLYSFIKTFFTVFLGIAFYAYDIQQIDIFTVAFATGAAKISLIGALRNVYKFLTEGDVKKL